MPLQKLRKRIGVAVMAASLLAAPAFAQSQEAEPAEPTYKVSHKLTGESDRSLHYRLQFFKELGDYGIFGRAKVAAGRDISYEGRFAFSREIGNGFSVVLGGEKSSGEPFGLGAGFGYETSGDRGSAGLHVIPLTMNFSGDYLKSVDVEGEGKLDLSDNYYIRGKGRLHLSYGGDVEAFGKIGVGRRLSENWSVEGEGVFKDSGPELRAGIRYDIGE